MKILEAISFGAIALSIHIIAISFVFPEILGSNQKDEDGERETITLSSLSFSASDLVKVWDTPPETKSEVSELRSVNQFQNMKLPLTTVEVDAEIEIGPLSKPQLLQNNQIADSPQIPSAFSATVYSSVSIDKVSFQNNDKASLDLPDKIDANPIIEKISNSQQKPTLETLKPQIDTSTMIPVTQPQKAHVETEIASLPEKPASGSSKSLNRQPQKIENQVNLSSKDTKIIKENLYSWGSKIHGAIERQKFYPSGTRAQGRVILNLIVQSDGRLVKTEIFKSSGTALLDKAALTAVKRANLPVAPEALTEDKYRFQIPIKMSRN
jgi:TonB family protein